VVLCTPAASAPPGAPSPAAGSCARPGAAWCIRRSPRWFRAALGAQHATYAAASPSLTIASNTRSTLRPSSCFVLCCQMAERNLNPAGCRAPREGNGAGITRRGCPSLGCCSLIAKGAQVLATKQYCVVSTMRTRGNYD
jgi:hypothetical protein